jgi:predicted RNA-binding protein with PIN domain
VRLLTDYAAKKGHRIVLVFDGGSCHWPYKEKKGAVLVVYSGIHESADDYIRSYIRDHQGDDMLLVSSDRALCMWASGHEIPSLGALDFYALVVHQTDALRQESATCHAEAIVKTSGGASSEEIDRLMYEGSVGIVCKEEDATEKKGGRTCTTHRCSKRERNLLKKVKKL